MNIRISLSTLLLTLNIGLAYGQHQKKPKSDFDIVPLNSPVKEKTAKFLLKAPTGFEIQQLSYRIQNSIDLFEKNKNYTLTNLVAGQQGKELHIPMKDLDSGFYKLYVKVKTKKDKEKEYHYSSAYNDFVKFTYEKTLGEVPEPDPALNNSTLGGIDSDNDGIRDDVQLWISKSYPQSTSPNIYYGLKQVSRHFQVVLINHADREKALPNYIKTLEALQCLMWIRNVGSRNDGYRKYKELKSQILNTPERIKAYLKVDSYRSGEGRPESIQNLKVSERNQLCEFSASKE